MKDCLRVGSFTTPRTGGTVSVVQKSNKDNKSVASPSAPRQATQTMGRQDACVPEKGICDEGSIRERCIGCDSW